MAQRPWSHFRSAVKPDHRSTKYVFHKPVRVPCGAVRDMRTTSVQCLCQLFFAGFWSSEGAWKLKFQSVRTASLEKRCQCDTDGLAGIIHTRRSEQSLESILSDQMHVGRTIQGKSAGQSQAGLPRPDSELRNCPFNRPLHYLQARFLKKLHGHAYEVLLIRHT